MQSMPTLSDRELLARMPTLVRAEQAASAEVIAHLMEIERRRLDLGEACSSRFAYCRERLGYSEDGALKRMRVAPGAGSAGGARSWAKHAASRGANWSICWLGFFRDRTWQSGLLRSPGFPQVPVSEQAQMNSAAERSRCRRRVIAWSLRRVATFARSSSE